MKNKKKPSLKPVLFIVGPTASGKTKVSLALAKALRGEIISVDSMQVYRGMDIGTAKPSRAQRRNIRHHLIDFLSPGKEFSVFEYRQYAIQCVNEITRKKKTPIFVGGTGLYVRSVIQGLTPLPGKNKVLRGELERIAKEKGVPWLYKRLQKKAPGRASQIKPMDSQRIIRALEIVEAKEKGSGRRKRPQKTLKQLGYAPIVLGLTRERAELYRDIEKRVDAMFRKGLVREVKKLASGRLSVTAGKAVGYKEIICALNGDYSLERAKELIKRNSRRLAKRQWTWFRKEDGIAWFSWEAGESPVRMKKRLLTYLNQGGFLINGVC